jgi:curved DNA-binding protein CbpA
MKDYYLVLGVQRSAEDIVIKHAYKVLAQKYHPDRVPDSDKESATQKMMEINEAKDVLLDPAKRNRYDKAYDEQKVDRQSFGAEFNEQEQFSESSLKDDDWNTAVSYYPDLKKIIKELSLISTNLTNLYKNYMLESKQYKQRHKIREDIENDYLIRFYGDDKKIRLYVKKLLLKNFKHAAIAINKDILVMGNSITYRQIYPRIEKKFPDAKICRLPLEVQPITRINPTTTILRRIDDPYLDQFISRLESNDIFPEDVCLLFDSIFNTDVTPQGDIDTRTYSFMLQGRRYNQDISYLKRKLIEKLSITD